MKTYISHKRVQAAPIATVGSPVIVVKDGEGFENIIVPDDFYARGHPKEGDYLVRYEPDGYLSWSPKAVFEAGYTEAVE